MRALNHISRVCKDVQASAAFYRDVLGFEQVKRPSSFDFEGAWLFNYGIGIHLIAGQPIPRSSKIEPKSDHLSFQVDSLEDVAQQLNELGLEFVKTTIEEGGVMVTQLFFHDPDNNMIEICNCDLIPVVPLDTDMICSSCMSASYSLSTAVSLSNHLPSHRISNHVDLDTLEDSSHSHSSSVSTGSMDDMFPSASASLFTTLIQESTPHTGIRPGLRRVCSMNFPLNITIPRTQAKDLHNCASARLGSEAIRLASFGA